MKTWLITGCSSGFGNELVKIALNAGDSVIATSRNKERLSSLEEEFGDKVLTVSMDVTDPTSVKNAVKEGLAWKGQIDVVVNNAGFGNIGSIEETSLEHYKQMYDVNVFGVVNVLHAVLPHMRERKSGHILNVSSVAGLTSMPGLGAYCSSKFALEGISEALAAELAPLGISVTIIEPGAFRTKFVGNIIEETAIADYDATAGPMRQMIKTMADNAPGDPVKAAKAMFNVASMNKPPVRLVLGKDALGWAKDKVKVLETQLTAHEDISTSTDF